MDQTGKWGVLNVVAAKQILQFSSPDKVLTRAQTEELAEATGRLYGTTFSPNRTKLNAVKYVVNKDELFKITASDPEKFTIFIPHLVNGLPNGGGTSTTISRNLVTLVEPPAWAGLVQQGGRRKRKSRRSKSKKRKTQRR
jgi:hypothetical protein